MLFSAEQAFVGRDEKRAPLKTPAWETNSKIDLMLYVYTLSMSSRMTSARFNNLRVHNLLATLAITYST